MTGDYAGWNVGVSLVMSDDWSKCCLKSFHGQSLVALVGSSPLVWGPKEAVGCDDGDGGNRQVLPENVCVNVEL